MPDQIGNTSLASAGRNKNSVMQPATASGPTSQIPVALKGRLRCLSLMQSIITDSATIMKANKVPELEIPPAYRQGEKNQR
ncbi:hypothetical protein [Nitrosomonas sp.]|uniref:hypothetical protein n=1 Tax=Nitrosomonas sp. TaxID=42353 RepID=UPI0025E89363|nr:hypothetical protein [Nitrosomonas sp.]